MTTWITDDNGNRASVEYWLSDGYNGPDSVRETVGFALDWMEGKKP